MRKINNGDDEIDGDEKDDNLHAGWKSKGIV